MAYSEKLLDHYQNPRNVGSLDRAAPNVGTGVVGAPECGDVMKLQIMVDEQDNIVDAKFKTFGCGSAIASSSLATEWIKGRKLEDALAIRNTDIVRELALPPVKIHCSVLAEDAVRAAVHDLMAKRKSQRTGGPGNGQPPAGASAAAAAGASISSADGSAPAESAPAGERSAAR
ncbi:MAG: Fe-S cluster assembly scaffold IscU [Planctomycetota bacterium]